MSEKDRDIDALLRRNVEQQLADFDWEQFRLGIRGRLAGCHVRSGSWSPYGRWLATAAGIALVGGVLVLAMIRVTGLGLGRSATGEATVAMIENGVSAGSAQVTFEHAGTPVRCEVAILASDKPQQPKNLKPASWCIVAAHGPSAERRPDDGDVSDVLCLF